MASVSDLSNPKFGTVAFASSVLQKNTKLYGAMNALDAVNSSSSWNSEGQDGSSPSTFTVDFGRNVKPTNILWQFQAGFSAETCLVYADGNSTALEELELEDIHEVQSHTIPVVGSVRRLKFVFEDCTDFYNRLIIYKIVISGHEEDGDQP